MKFTPRPFQKAAIDHAVQFLLAAKRGDKQSYAAPTGCGKSVVELCVQEQLNSEPTNECWIVSPREEIIAGMLDKLDDPDGDMLRHRICTPIRLRNMMLKGEVRPTHLIFDEGHHHNAESWQQIDLLTGMAPAASYTASPYRGTPRGTAEFLEHWGETLWLITFQEAVDAGYIKMPRFEVLPLVDDDLVDISGGDFSVTSLTSVTVDRLQDMANHAAKWYKDGRWDVPTVFALPSSATCVRLQQELIRLGCPTAIVSAETPKADRYTAFRGTEACILALLHINVITEGIDLPLRRLVDLAPTLSPVKWVQQLGRITRPTDETPVYLGTNRNMLRHAYILEGVVPTAAIAAAEKAFPQSERANARVLGLEAIGRFKPASVQLLSGVTLQVYAVSVPMGPTVVEYAVLVHPNSEPVWASKVNTVKGGVRSYGSWVRSEPPQDMRGFGSVPAKALSDKQMAWWKRSASRVGIDPQQEPNRKNFQALPVMFDLGIVMR